MRVKSCAASDGAGHVIKLSDEFGCVLRPKMISKFLKAKGPDDRATVITYAFFHAFKFPDALSVHIKCKVEICRHGCLDHCQTSGVPGNLGNHLSGGAHEHLQERKDTIIEPNENEQDDNSLNDHGDDEPAHHHDTFYDDIIHKTDENYPTTKRDKKEPAPVHQHDIDDDIIDLESLFSRKPAAPEKKQPIYQPQNQPQQSKQRQAPPPPPPQAMQSKMTEDKFPHGPRQLQYAQSRAGLPMAGPRALDLDELEKEQQQTVRHSVYRKRTKRSIKVTNRNARSADVGVSGMFDVISEADLAFSPDNKQEAVTVFQGKITEEVVYGICLPVQGFSIVFILIISSIIVAALIAGSLMYRYQLQKDAIEQQHAAVNPSTIANWMTMRLFRMRHSPMTNDVPTTSRHEMESRQ
jgi:hypothetical protein